MLCHLSPYHAAFQNLQREQIEYGNPGIRVPVSAGIWAPGSGSALTTLHPVRYPVPDFEAGVQLHARGEG